MSVSLKKCVTNQASEVEAINLILNKLTTQNCDLKHALDQLNDIIRSNHIIRQKGLPNEFYSNLNLILNNLLKSRPSEQFWSEFESLIKCLKNSGAAFKSEVNSNELEICKTLIEFANEILESEDTEMLNEKRNDKFKSKCFVFIMQYFFNLSQGNNTLLKHFMEDWLNICFRLLNTKDIVYEIYDLASMVMVNICIDKHNEPLLDTYFKTLASRNFVCLINKVFSNLDYVRNQSQKAKEAFVDIDQEELEFLLDETNSNWSLRLISYLLQNEAYLHLLLAEFDTYDLIDRINLLKMLKNNLNAEQESSGIRRTILDDSKLIEIMVCLYTKASGFFLENLVQITQSEEFEAQQIEYSVLVHMHLTEIKYLAYCLSDLLTLEHNTNIQIRLKYAQSNIKVLHNTCDIFRQLHANLALKNLFEVLKSKEIYSATHSNLKCELIRLIGILVYENKLNQDIIAQNKVMELIANTNLGLDLKNPFVREWSLIALKHVLINNDLK